MNQWTTAGVGPSAVDRWNRSLMAMMLVLPSNYYLSVQPASSSSPLLQHTHFAGYAPLPLTFLPWRTRANAFTGGPSVSLVQSQPQAAAGDGRLSAEATGRVGVEIMVRMAYPNSTVGMDGALKLTYDLTALASLLDPIFEPDTAGATFYVIDHRMAVLYSSNRSVYSSALSELNLAHIDPCLAVALRDKLGLHPPEPRQADGSGDPRYSCGGCDAVPDGADDSNFLAMVFDYYLRRWQRGGNESELSRPRSVPRLSPGLRAFALGLCTSPQLRSQLRRGLGTSWQHARTAAPAGPRVVAGTRRAGHRLDLFNALPNLRGSKRNGEVLVDLPQTLYGACCVFLIVRAACCCTSYACMVHVVCSRTGTGRYWSAAADVCRLRSVGCWQGDPRIQDLPVNPRCAVGSGAAREGPAIGASK
jgi:hypothetical protein